MGLQQPDPVVCLASKKWIRPVIKLSPMRSAKSSRSLVGGKAPRTRHWIIYVASELQAPARARASNSHRNIGPVADDVGTFDGSMEDVGKTAALVPTQAEPPNRIPHLSQVISAHIVTMPDAGEIGIGPRLRKVLNHIDRVDGVNFWSPYIPLLWEHQIVGHCVIIQIDYARNSNVKA
jgi:hypothetical protein